MKCFSGMGADVVMRLTSSDSRVFFGLMNQKGIVIRSVRYVDELSVLFVCSRKDIPYIQSIASKRDDKLELCGHQGFSWKLRALIKRPVLVFGLLFLAALICLLPETVLLIEVEGNESITSREILERAEECGIRFGASRRNVRSERVKNRLLEAVPQLQWAGINTYGCRAVISVRERPETQHTDILPDVSSIVAARDGIIEFCTVTKGNGLCQPGQAVSKGDILISGLTDCGITIKATRAEGEVFATTEHEITVITPYDYLEKRCSGEKKIKFALRIGKKHIFFYKDSGISYTGCDKMYKEYCLSLPGGFQLPVAWIVEEYCFHDASDVSASAADPFAVAESFAEEYLQRMMISGKILSFQVAQEQDQDVCILHGVYVCSEMIGRVHNEEIITEYGEDR